MIAAQWPRAANFSRGSRRELPESGLLGSRVREAAGKDAALAGLTLDVQAALVPQQDMLDDGQAKAGTAGAAGAAGVDPVEAFGQAWQVLGLDADARVLHGQVRTIFVSPPAQVNLPARGAVFHRIEQQVGKGAAQFGFTATQL